VLAAALGPKADRSAILTRFTLRDRLPKPHRPKVRVQPTDPYFRSMLRELRTEQSEAMADPISAASMVLAVSAQAEKTVRSPLLYAWLTVQALVVLAVIYGLYRLARKLLGVRRSRG
jgi:hypothetical protein